MQPKTGAPEETRGIMSSDAIEWNETWLIKRIAEQDRHAFEIFYKTYFQRLAIFLRRLSRNAHLTEEIINDTMMVVWQKAHTYNHTSKVSTWIFSIAYRQGLKAIRKNEVPVEENFEEPPGRQESEPDRELDYQQLKKIIENALSTLSIEQRSVVALTYYHGMAYEEIAQTMECPVNTVKTRMFHARQKLKSLLSAYQQEAF
jgi:RNA polymerase sigma factor (sigma-70 family)